MADTPTGSTPERPETISEDQEPSARTELTEDEVPAPSPVVMYNLMQKAREKEGLHRTRRWLAIALFWLVGLLTMVPVIALVLSHWTHFTVDEFKELGLFFTPVVTLAGAAFGFFFASPDRDHHS